MDNIKTILKKPEKYNFKDISKLVKETKVLDVSSEYLYLLPNNTF